MRMSSGLSSGIGKIGVEWAFQFFQLFCIPWLGALVGWVRSMANMESSFETPNVSQDVFLKASGIHCKEHVKLLVTSWATSWALYLKFRD